jgi:ATP-dependent RNA helicase SUPV3L1/SUV3
LGPGAAGAGERQRAESPAADAGGRPERRGEGKGPPKGQRGGKGPKDKGRRDGPRDGADDQPRRFEAKPPRQDKPIDPDSPFAILQQLKNR